MKTSRLHPSSSAFTLIELLVVISIIAVLASLSIPAISGVMVNAHKAQARNDMAQIANAIKLYYTEYGRYPIDSSSATITDANAIYGVGKQGNDTIISVLRDKTSTNVAQTTLDTLNPRQIKFIEPKVTDMKKACVNKTSGNWYDPWGTQYIIFIDADYGDDIEPNAAITGLNVDANNKAPVSVGVASVGYYYVKNKQKQDDALSGQRAYDKKTDLISWL